MRIIFPWICLFMLVLFMTGCSSPGLIMDKIGSPDPASASPSPGDKRKLVVFAAGSLIIPFQELEKAFEQAYPDIDAQMEYHGSIQVIRHVTEIHEQIDVVASADVALIPQLMFAVQDQETGRSYSNWYIRFAGNELALAYQPDSRYASEINSANWAEVLARPDVRLGLSDPRFDALGYRALMTFALQEELQESYTLFNPMFSGQFSNPVTIFREDERTLIHVPEILETTRDAHILMRGASIQLVALLESGDIDYAFEYVSVIRQRGLKMVSLLDQVNLSQQEWDDFYNRVEVGLDFKRFSSVQPRFRGERIGYGITIPSNAPHPEAAEAFISYLLSDEGRSVMEQNYHPMFEQPLAKNFEAVPANLQKYVKPEGGP